MEGYSSILMMVLLVGVFYFMLIRPENKRKKKAQELRDSLKKGDIITSIGGIVGKIVMVTSDTVIIETSEDRVRMELTKWAISSTGVQATTDTRDAGKKKSEPAELPEEPVDEIPAEEEEKN